MAPRTGKRSSANDPAPERRETRRQRKYRLRRDAIIEAARRVFERKGYEGASIEEIAGEADFAKGSIYYYFQNKPALLEAVFGDAAIRFSEHCREIAAGNGTPLDRLRHLVREILGFYERNFALFRVAATAAAPGGDAGAPHAIPVSHIDDLARDREWILGVLEEARKAGSLTSDIEADEVADIVRGLIAAEVRRWDERGRKEKLLPKADIILRLLFDGLSPTG